MNESSQKSEYYKLPFGFVRIVANLLSSLIAGAVAIVAGLPIASVFSGVNESGFPIQDSIWFKLLWSLFLATGMIFGFSSRKPWRVKFVPLLKIGQVLNLVCILISAVAGFVVFRNSLSPNIARDCVTFGAFNVLAYCYLGKLAIAAPETKR